MAGLSDFNAPGAHERRVLIQVAESVIDLICLRNALEKPVENEAAGGGLNSRSHPFPGVHWRVLIATAAFGVAGSRCGERRTCKIAAIC